MPANLIARAHRRTLRVRATQSDHIARFETEITGQPDQSLLGPGQQVFPLPLTSRHAVDGQLRLNRAGVELLTGQQIGSHWVEPGHLLTQSLRQQAPGAAGVLGLALMSEIHGEHKTADSAMGLSSGPAMTRPRQHHGNLPHHRGHTSQVLGQIKLGIGPRQGVRALEKGLRQLTVPLFQDDNQTRTPYRCGQTRSGQRQQCPLGAQHTSSSLSSAAASASVRRCR